VDSNIKLCQFEYESKVICNKKSITTQLLLFFMQQKSDVFELALLFGNLGNIHQFLVLGVLRKMFLKIKEIPPLQEAGNASCKSFTLQENFLQQQTNPQKTAPNGGDFGVDPCT
jgi:hypothetical protein